VYSGVAKMIFQSRCLLFAGILRVMHAVLLSGVSSELKNYALGSVRFSRIINSIHQWRSPQDLCLGSLLLADQFFSLGVETWKSWLGLCVKIKSLCLVPSYL